MKRTHFRNAFFPIFCAKLALISFTEHKSDCIFLFYTAFCRGVTNNKSVFD